MDSLNLTSKDNGNRPAVMPRQKPKRKPAKAEGSYEDPAKVKAMIDSDYVALLNRLRFRTIKRHRWKGVDLECAIGEAIDDARSGQRRWNTAKYRSLDAFLMSAIRSEIDHAWRKESLELIPSKQLSDSESQNSKRESKEKAVRVSRVEYSGTLEADLEHGHYFVLSDQQARIESQERVDLAIKKLDLDQDAATIFRLRLNGFDCRQIANELNLSLNDVTRIKSRFDRKLRSLQMEVAKCPRSLRK